MHTERECPCRGEFEEWRIVVVRSLRFVCTNWWQVRLKRTHRRSNFDCACAEAVVAGHVHVVPSRDAHPGTCANVRVNHEPQQVRHLVALERAGFRLLPRKPGNLARCSQRFQSSRSTALHSRPRHNHPEERLQLQVPRAVVHQRQPRHNLHILDSVLAGGAAGRGGDVHVDGITHGIDDAVRGTCRGASLSTGAASGGAVHLTRCWEPEIVPKPTHCYSNGITRPRDSP